jgi:multidrug efflux system membrane fusion protein
MRHFASLVSAVAVLYLCAACSSSDDGPGKKGTVTFPVEVMSIPAERVEYTVPAVGSVEAFEVVQITARVSGVVERVRFAEGDTVGPARVLAEIEPERFRIAVQSARANLARAEAARAEAEAGLGRREGANAENPGLIPGEELESWRTRARSASAEVSQAEAALDLAELNQRDALVRAPAKGIIQTRSVQTGQFVQPGAVLATLVRRDPLLLRFRVPEQEAGPIHPGMPAFFTVGESDREYAARIVLVAERAEPATRMVSVTAEVMDPDTGQLRPGAFAQVRVPVGLSTDAAVIPQMAVRPSERGFLAYVVEGDVARERVVALGLRTADGNVEVREGLRPGEMLIVRGAEAVYDGAGVKVVADYGEESGL